MHSYVPVGRTHIHRSWCKEYSNIGACWQTDVSLHNRGANLMSGNSRKRHEWIEAAERIQITSAKPDHSDSQQYVAVRGNRLRDGLDRGVSGLVK
jgi:hypothetical protein